MKLKRTICLLLALSCLGTCCLAASDPADEPMFLDSRTVLVGDSLTCMLIAQWLRPGNLLGGAGRIAAPSSAARTIRQTGAFAPPSRSASVTITPSSKASSRKTHPVFMATL